MNMRALRECPPVSWDCIDGGHWVCRDGGETGEPRTCACDCHSVWVDGELVWASYIGL